MHDPLFTVEVLAQTPNPQQLVWKAMHQDYSEDFVAAEAAPSERQAGTLVCKHLLAGNKGHYGCLEHPAITFATGWFPHSVMQQARTHRVNSFDVQCVAGDTELMLLGKDGKIECKRTIEELYRRWQADPAEVRRLRVRSLDENRNCYTTNHIDAVIASGVKPVFLVTLEDGKTIRCTQEHRILSVNGWRELGELVPGDKVMVNGRATADAPDTYQNKQWLSQRFDRGLTPKELAMEAGVSVQAVRKWAYHHGLSWTKYQCKRGVGFRLNLSDAERRRRSLHASTVLAAVTKPRGHKHPSFKSDLSPEARAYNWLKYARPQLLDAAGHSCADCGDKHRRLHCHHVVPVEVRPDLGCETSNIRVLCPRCHKRAHALSAHPVRITAIEPAGECATYDIAMQAPHHNFVANGIVVHNSMRYTGERILKAAAGSIPIEEVFYLRPVGKYNDRHGAKFEYTQSMRNRDISHCLQAADAYAERVGQGMPFEQARGLIPFDFRQHFVVSFNLRSLMHFLDLRAKKDAQLEIQALCGALYPHFQAWTPEVANWYTTERLHKARLSP